MAFNDNAVFTASTGYIYLAPVGTAAPTPAQLKNFDPEAFGAHTYLLGEVSGESFTLTVGSDNTEPLKKDASAAEVQAALEKLPSVGTGGALVKGLTLAQGYTVSFIGESFGKEVQLTAEGAAANEMDKPIGWEPVGHTGNEDLPEFGYDGGDSETKGSWQKKNLREVTTEAPVDYVTVKALQFDAETLELYYGKNASSVDGVFGVDNPASSGVERAVLIVLVDGQFKIGFSAAKASLRRDESIALATDDFATLPLRATFTKHPGRHLFEWTAPAA
ncbi:phage tail protein [uncultured Corynebacterium sp.]|uniref:phage tail tube protein n=1 Tax=uncultured Corynebacterium sp. TaxID=159447 RepID=UPI00262B1E38|nr:phage tail protein [uncultured Corynebacterium sp.]